MVENFMVSVLVLVIRGKKHKYMIEMDDEENFQYILGFVRRGKVDNLRIYTVLKLRPDGLFREDVHEQRQMAMDDEY